MRHWGTAMECIRIGERCGAGGTRTPYLFNAIEALSRLSYSPMRYALEAYSPIYQNGVSGRNRFRSVSNPSG